MYVLKETSVYELAETGINNLLQFRKIVALGLENPTNEDKPRWLEMLQTKVTISIGIAVITCRLGVNFRYNLYEIELHQS